MDKKLEAILLRNKKDCPPSLSFSIVLEALAEATKKEKEIKGI